MSSVFITGSSGVGKSTLAHELIGLGFLPAPNHLSRSPRLDEVEGVDAVYVSQKIFEENFANDMYLEESLNEAEYLGVYYGSPRSWVEATTTATNTVSVPANVNVLRRTLDSISEPQRAGIVWVNLFASTALRRQRLSARRYDPEELEGRLYSGVSHGPQKAAHFNIDTEKLSPKEIADIVTRHAYSLETE